jgi:hypothetical protein
MAAVSRRTFLKVAGATGAAVLSGCRVVENDAASSVATGAAGPEPTDGLSTAPTEILITPTGSLYTQSYSRVEARRQ